MEGNPKEKFTGKAELYQKYRPSYPKECLFDLMQQCGLTAGSKVADMGAGTGIFTKCLLETGITVYAVEPNPDMLKKLKGLQDREERLVVVSGPAEHSSLPDSSVNLVTAAQAFHWFDKQAFQEECRRILKPEGTVALIWNVRVEDHPMVQDLKEICYTHCPDFQGFSGGSQKKQDGF